MALLGWLDPGVDLRLRCAGTDCRVGWCTDRRRYGYGRDRPRLDRRRSWRPGHRDSWCHEPLTGARCETDECWPMRRVWVRSCMVSARTTGNSRRWARAHAPMASKRDRPCRAQPSKTYRIHVPMSGAPVSNAMSARPVTMKRRNASPSGCTPRSNRPAKSAETVDFPAAWGRVTRKMPTMTDRISTTAPPPPFLAQECPRRRGKYC